MSDAIVKSIGPQLAPFEFTADQQKMIRDSFLNGAPEGEAVVLMELARLRRLNPILRQIHFVKRWDGMKRCEVWSAQVGIDGLRAIAERTGKYDGQDEPEFNYEGKALKSCRVKVYRKDWTRPAVGVAHFSEYAQTNKEGKLTKMWAEKPHVMLAKCAEALAMRKAFPEDLSGLYAPEEMGAEEKEVNAPPPRAAPAAGKRTAALRETLAARRASSAAPEDADTGPPPPDDIDAPPHDEETGEVLAVPEVPAGKNRGTPVSALSDAQLRAYLEVAAKGNGRTPLSNAEWVATVNAEVERRK